MRANKGFTLIELMIVVAIVAIIAAIALPSYQEQVRRGKRADGKAFLLDIASRQERLYSEKLSYSKDVTAATGLNYASNNSPEGKYSVAIVTTPANCGPVAPAAKCTGFTATVTPIPATGDPKCATLTYNHLGVKGHSGTGTVEECWK